MRGKAKAINNIIDMFVDQDIDHGKDLAYHIFCKVGEDRDMLVFKKQISNCPLKML